MIEPKPPTIWGSIGLSILIVSGMLAAIGVLVFIAKVIDDYNLWGFLGLVACAIIVAVVIVHGIHKERKISYREHRDAYEEWEADTLEQGR